MRTGLRGKILLITTITPLTLGLVAFITVHRNVQQHVNSTSIHENLQHSAQVFENMLAVRLRALGGGARVIAQDPRFFSLVMLGPSQRDARFVATVRGMAREFNRITETDLFEVFDRHHRVLASVGQSHSLKAARDSLVSAAIAGREVAGVLSQGHQHFQVAVTPVRADGQIVGALMLGAGIGAPLAIELRKLMLSEVTFISGDQITGTTLVSPADREALMAALGARNLSATSLASLGVIQVQARNTTFLTRIGRIPLSPDYPLQLYVMQRSYDPETAFLKRMQHDLGLLAILALVAALVTGLVLSEQIMRPIRVLVQGARAMEQGDFGSPIEVRNRDEIGYLAERFRVMRDRERAYVSSLEEAARLKSEFISVASHELRTPISVIEGYRELLADGSLGPLDARQQQALTAIREGLSQLTKVADDATHVAQVESERITLEPGPCKVGVLVEHAIGEALAAASGRAVQVRKQIDPGLDEMWLDATRMKQALTHLISNSIRFTPDGGHVEVLADLEKSQVVIEVRDTGVGIPPERLGHIFERSLMVRDSLRHHSSNRLEFGSAGLGLGLAIVRGIVEAHGGTISAASEVGSGSQFTIRLPREEPATRRRAA
jgi:signal transduction histidine kinase